MDWKLLNNVLHKSKNIILTTHVNPDADGVGSELGLYYYIKHLNMNCRIINSSILADHYDFLDPENVIEIFDINKHEDIFKNSDLVIALDIGDYKRMNNIVKMIDKYHIYSVSIDHHPEQEKFFDLSLVNLKSPATGYMVWQFLKFNNYSNLSLIEANALYSALITDTGSFKYNSTTAECHLMAAHLIECGVKPYDIYDVIYERRELSQIRLLSLVISKLKFHCEGEFASFVITQKDLEFAKATTYDVEGFTDFVRQIKGVQVAFMLLEQKYDIRINFRSRGKYIINDIAQKFGGGGHKLAAGATIRNKTIDEIQEKIIKLLKRKK